MIRRLINKDELSEAAEVAVRGDKLLGAFGPRAEGRVAGSARSHAAHRVRHPAAGAGDLHVHEQGPGARLAQWPVLLHDLVREADPRRLQAAAPLVAGVAEARAGHVLVAGVAPLDLGRWLLLLGEPRDFGIGPEFLVKVGRLLHRVQDEILKLDNLAGALCRLRAAKIHVTASGQGVGFGEPPRARNADSDPLSILVLPRLKFRDPDLQDDALLELALQTHGRPEGSDSAPAGAAAGRRRVQDVLPGHDYTSWIRGRFWELFLRDDVAKEGQEALARAPDKDDPVPVGQVAILGAEHGAEGFKGSAHEQDGHGSIQRDIGCTSLGRGRDASLEIQGRPDGPGHVELVHEGPTAHREVGEGGAVGQVHHVVAAGTVQPPLGVEDVVKDDAAPECDVDGPGVKVQDDLGIVTLTLARHLGDLCNSSRSSLLVPCCPLSSTLALTLTLALSSTLALTLTLASTLALAVVAAARDRAREEAHCSSESLNGAIRWKLGI